MTITKCCSVEISFITLFDDTVSDTEDNSIDDDMVGCLSLGGTIWSNWALQQQVFQQVRHL